MVSALELPVAPHPSPSTDSGSTEEVAELTRCMPVPTARRLVLRPANPDSPSEPVVVTQFPFVFGRDTQAVVGTPQRFLSRQHACLVLRSGRPHLLDLASTNGTWVDGQQLLALEERLLSEGSTVAFGSLELLFDVHLEQGFDITAPEGPSADLDTTPDDFPGTLYMQAGRPFLDALCDHKHTAAGNDTDANGGAPCGEDPVGNRPQRALPRRPGILGRWRKAAIFVTELKAAFADDQPGRFPRRWVLAGLTAAALAVTGGSYLQQAPEREIRGLIKAGDYGQAIQRANGYLERDPDDGGLVTLAEEAQVRYLVPAWQRALVQGRYAVARNELASAPEPQRARNEEPAIETLLNWITDLHEFAAAQGGSEAPIQLFDHELRMEALLQRWNQDGAAFRHLLVWIQNQIPAFERVHGQALSQLRALRNEASVHLDAIDELKTTIAERVATNQLRELPPVLERFGQTYPRVHGLEAIATDLEALLAVRDKLEARDLTALDGAHGLSFQTPLFAEHGRGWLQANLPPQPLLTAYGHARQHWLHGRTDQAITILARLRHSEWDEVIADRLAHYRSVSMAYAALRAGVPVPPSRNRVLDFYRSLDPTEDGYFLRMLDDLVDTHRERALAEARELLDQARESWQGYQRGGAISGLMRLQPDLSQTFQTQTRQLADALQSARLAGRLYALLGLEPSSDERALYLDVVTEVSRQRQWLGDLNLVLDPALLQQKLELLPTLEENRS